MKVVSTKKGRQIILTTLEARKLESMAIVYHSRIRSLKVDKKLFELGDDHGVKFQLRLASFGRKLANALYHSGIQEL